MVIFPPSLWIVFCSRSLLLKEGTHAVKQSKQKMTKPPVAPLPRETQEEARLQREREASLLIVVTEILSQIDDDNEFRPFAGIELAEHRSLEWLAEETAQELLDNERAYLEPTRESGCQRYKQSRRNYFDQQDKLEDFLKRRPGAIEEAIKDIMEYRQEAEKLYLTIGFAIGMRAAKRELESKLKELGAAAAEQFTIASPKPAEEQLQMIDKMARQIRWNHPEDYARYCQTSVYAACPQNRKDAEFLIRLLKGRLESQTRES